MRFDVALSFAGENRRFVEKVAEHLSHSLKMEKVFYDNYYQPELARINLDTHLQNIYVNESKLVVIFLCKNYADKEWCRLEWRAIKEIIKKRRDESIMFFRFDDVEIDGLFSSDGYILIEKKVPLEICNYILERLKISPENNLLENSSTPEINKLAPTRGSLLSTNKFFKMRAKEISMKTQTTDYGTPTIVDFLVVFDYGNSRITFYRNKIETYDIIKNIGEIDNREGFLNSYSCKSQDLENFTVCEFAPITKDRMIFTIEKDNSHITTLISCAFIKE